MQESTQSGEVRPFGVSLLIAGYDDNSPQLYQVDPSGSYFSWKASALGNNVSNAKAFLEKRYTDDMEIEDAIHTAILTLKEGFEGRISSKNIEIGIIGTDKKFNGMGPDSRVLVRKIRKEAEQYLRLHKEAIPVTQIVRETAAVMQEFTQSGGVRPFGVSLLIAGYDDDCPQLYQFDPSGSYFSWKASAMGKNASNAKVFLEKRYTEDMEIEDAIHTTILTLKDGCCPQRRLMTIWLKWSD